MTMSWEEAMANPLTIKMRVVKSDLGQVPRYVEGEVGVMLKNDMPKIYDYFVWLRPREPELIAEETQGDQIQNIFSGVLARREMYFYEEEVEVLGPGTLESLGLAEVGSGNA